MSAALVVLVLAGIGAQSHAAQGWHRCQPLQGYGLASLCDGRGRVLFPYVIERSENSSRTQVVRGSRRIGTKRAFVDAHADWGILQGECGQNGVIENCRQWSATEKIRYRTSDGGKNWLPVSFHRKVTKLESRGPDPPVSTGSVEDDPPLRPCDWSHAHRHVLVDGFRPGLGNWCAPADEWTVPESLLP
jgi:hypothetical protein